MTAELDEDRFNMAIRKFLKHVGVTSQREIENLVRSGEVKGGKLKLQRMTLSAEGTPLKHVVEETVAL
jgi:16S rRNA U516 pseudouridylate synthase RsuA-like enzyme